MDLAPKGVLELFGFFKTFFRNFLLSTSVALQSGNVCVCVCGFPKTFGAA